MIPRLAVLLVPALLLSAGNAGAQCASRASSCVQCHETERCRDVRDSGEIWHRDHALGDFCAGCHGGDAEATSEAEAHRGLAGPLADPERSCAPCHAGNHGELAARYATALAAKHQRPPAPAAPPRPAAPDNSGALGALVAALGIGAGALVALTERRRDRLAHAGRGGAP